MKDTRKTQEQDSVGRDEEAGRAPVALDEKSLQAIHGGWDWCDERCVPLAGGFEDVLWHCLTA